MNSLPHRYSPISITGGAGVNLSTGTYSGFSGQSNPLTLNQISHLSGLSYDSLSCNYKRYEIYELNEDALALSCTWKRLRDTNDKIRIHINSITSAELFDNITTEDKEFANKVRDHYSKKIMMLKLKGTKLTNFREDLNKFVHGDGNKVTEDMFPLIYRLPEFYDYDLKFTEIYTKADCNHTLSKNLHSKQQSMTLKPLGKLSRKTKTNKTIEYWFKEKTTDSLAMIPIDPKNELLPLWNRLFENKSTMEISGITFVKPIDEIEYLSIKKWDLINI